MSDIDKVSTIEQGISTVQEQLRLGPGFHAADQPHIVDVLSSLDRHLAHWRTESVDIRVSVKERDTVNQRTTLELWLPGWHALLAHSQQREIEAALIDVRKVMIREIEEERSRREPHKGSAHQIR